LNARLGHPTGNGFGEADFAKLSKPGTDVMILEIFSQKKIAKKLAFLTQNKAKLCKFLIITLDFEKNIDLWSQSYDHE
jgi:hypothetical protein